MGGDTGLLTGNVEKFYNRVLKKTKDPIKAEVSKYNISNNSIITDSS